MRIKYLKYFHMLNAFNDDVKKEPDYEKKFTEIIQLFKI